MARPFKNKKRRGGNKGSIRPHRGFGKFAGGSLYDEAAYIWSMDSTDIHSNEGWGNSVTLVEGPFTADDCRNVVVDYDQKLNRRERREVVLHGAALVFESGDGFITVRW